MLILTACPNLDETSDGNFPDNPDKFVIRLSDGGGMLPISEDIYISKDTAHWTYLRYRNETVISWIPTKEEIDSLYTTFKENKIDQIKSDCEGEVFDRGGTRIDIDINQNDYRLDNSGNCFVMDKWADNYKAVSSAIRKYTTRKVNAQMLEIVISPSDSLLLANYNLTLVVNDEHIFTYDGEKPSEKTIKMYPGANQFYMQFFYKDSVNSYGTPITFKSDQLFIDVTDKTHKVVVDFSAGKFVVFPEN